MTSSTSSGRFASSTRSTTSTASSRFSGGISTSTSFRSSGGGSISRSRSFRSSGGRMTVTSTFFRSGGRTTAASCFCRSTIRTRIRSTSFRFTARPAISTALRNGMVRMDGIATRSRRSRTVTGVSRSTTVTPRASRRRSSAGIATTVRHGRFRFIIRIVRASSRCRGYRDRTRIRAGGSSRRSSRAAAATRPERSTPICWAWPETLRMQTDTRSSMCSRFSSVTTTCSRRRFSA